MEPPVVQSDILLQSPLYVQTDACRLQSSVIDETYIQAGSTAAIDSVCYQETKEWVCRCRVNLGEYCCMQGTLHLWGWLGSMSFLALCGTKAWTNANLVYLSWKYCIFCRLKRYILRFRIPLAVVWFRFKNSQGIFLSKSLSIDIREPRDKVKAA